MAEILCEDPYTGYSGDVIDDVIELIDSRFNESFWTNLKNWLVNKNIRSFKIGKTYRPMGRRNDSDYRHNPSAPEGYGYMDLVYRSHDYAEASWMEEELIEEFIEDNRCENKTIHAPGPTPPPDREYYVYVVYNVGPSSKHDSQEKPLHYDDDDDWNGDEMCRYCGSSSAARDCPFNECGNCCKSSDEPCPRHGG